MAHRFRVIDGGLGKDAKGDDPELLICPRCDGRVFVESHSPLVTKDGIESTGSVWLCLPCFVGGEVTEIW